MILPGILNAVFLERPNHKTYDVRLAKADVEILIKIMTPFVRAWKHALVTRNRLHSSK